MPAVRFPFWIVTQRRGFISKPVELAAVPGFIVAFSTAERAASFMVSRGESEWENRLITRSNLRQLVVDLRAFAVHGLCLDPAEDAPGTAIPFSELERI